MDFTKVMLFFETLTNNLILFRRLSLSLSIYIYIYTLPKTDKASPSLLR